MPDLVEVGLDVVEQQNRGQHQEKKSDQPHLAGAIGKLIEIEKDLILAGRQELGKENFLNLLFDVVECAEGGKEGESDRNQGHRGQQRRVRQARSADDHLVATELAPGGLNKLDDPNRSPLPQRKDADIETVQMIQYSHGSSPFHDNPNRLTRYSGRICPA